MPRYHVQAAAGYWLLIDRQTGEEVADIVDRKQAARVCELLNGRKPVESLPRPLLAEQLRLFEKGNPG